MKQVNHISGACVSTSVRAVILHQDKLLVEHDPNLNIYFCPGGRRNASEDLHDTLTRELREELANCHFEIGEYLGKIACFWTRNNAPDSCLHHYFEVKVVPKTTHCDIVAAEPGRRVCWISITSPEIENLAPQVLSQLLAKRLSRDFSLWDSVDGTPN